MIPFSPPMINQEIIDEVIDTLKSGWITTGPKAKLFEKRLSKYCGNIATLAVNSGTSGMKLILNWFGVGPGDEVILPVYTYCATANVILQCGAVPVMVDINEDDFNISIERIRQAITKNTKVIMPVDIAGYPCDYDKINLLVKENSFVKIFNPKCKTQKILGRILVLSDSAHSIGATLNNKMAGSLTDISVFSFHAVKNITTAEGGAICLNLPESFNNQDIYNELNIMALHGQTVDAYTKSNNNSWQYDVIEPGFKYNMTDILASIGLVQLNQYNDDILVRRRKIFDFYYKKLCDYRWALLPPYMSKEKKSSCHFFALRIIGIDEEERNIIIRKIQGKGVNVNVHFKPLPLLTAYKNLGYKIEDFPVAYRNYSTEISLPVYYNLLDKHLKTIINAVVKSVEEGI